MVRQIGPHFQEPSMIVLQERIHRLEDKVAGLTSAVQFLMRELDEHTHVPADAFIPETPPEVVPERA
jgi:hypothetical protein